MPLPLEGASIADSLSDLDGEGLGPRSRRDRFTPEARVGEVVDLAPIEGRGVGGVTRRMICGGRFWKRKMLLTGSSSKCTCRAGGSWSSAIIPFDLGSPVKH